MEDTNTPKRKLEDTTDDRQAKKKRTGDGESRNLKFEDNVDTSGEKRVFDGLYICVAGRLKKTRHDTSNFIKKHGGYFTKHVSKKVISASFYCDICYDSRTYVSNSLHFLLLPTSV